LLEEIIVSILGWWALSGLEFLSWNVKSEHSLGDLDPFRILNNLLLRSIVFVEHTHFLLTRGKAKKVWPAGILFIVDIQRIRLHTSMRLLYEW
jgi:hypothetical protein